MFVGRQEELALMERLYDERGFHMLVVYGRRRVGKTTLIGRFAQDKPTLSFTALDQGDADNLADFSAKVAEFFSLPAGLGSFRTWSDAFTYIADQAKKERFVFIFDEFPYAAKRNESLPSALQIAIDHGFSQGKAFLILCGSDQGFMESDVLGRKSPLYGRRSAQINLHQMGYLDAAKMLPGLDAQEQFRYYGCFGGVPYYLALVDPQASFRENMARLFFDPMGFLFEEPYALLRQELSEPALYNSILRAIAGGFNRPKEIADATGVPTTSLPKYLKTLERLDVVERAVPFGENPERSKRGIYRISDACYDFWFHFVMPRLGDISGGLGHVVARNIPDAQLDEYLGHRFERLCSEWLFDQARDGALAIPATTVGSWWGTNPKKKAQDDIDVLAADRVSKELVIGECKYRESFDESAELADLEDKRDLIKGYTATQFYLFSKRDLSPATYGKIDSDPCLRAVTLGEMYGFEA